MTTERAAGLTETLEHLNAEHASAKRLAELDGPDSKWAHYAEGMETALTEVRALLTARAALACLTCGAPIVDALAGSCGVCGAQDRHIGSQWLQMPADQRPFAPAPDRAGLDVERGRLRKAFWEANKNNVWGEAIDTTDRMADQVAAEYARLREDVTE